MKLKLIAAFVGLATVALLAGACGGDGATNTSNANRGANTNAGGNANAGGNTNAAANNKTPENSPIAAFNTLYAATQKKDIENIKKGLSASTIKLLGEIAKKQNRSEDETLKESLTDPDYNSPSVPEARNEKINGNQATIEIKAPKSGEWTELPFVKEEGRWKLAYDQLNQNDLATDQRESAQQPEGENVGAPAPRGAPAAGGSPARPQ